MSGVFTTYHSISPPIISYFENSSLIVYLVKIEQRLQCNRVVEVYEVINHCRFGTSAAHAFLIEDAIPPYLLVSVMKRTC